MSRTIALFAAIVVSSAAWADTNNPQDLQGQCLTGRVGALQVLESSPDAPPVVIMHFVCEDGTQHTIALGDPDYVRANLPIVEPGEVVQVVGDVVCTGPNQCFVLQHIDTPRGRYDVPTNHYNQALRGRVVDLRAEPFSQRGDRHIVATVVTDEGRTLRAIIGAENQPGPANLRPGSAVDMTGFIRHVHGQPVFVASDVQVLDDQRQARTWSAPPVEEWNNEPQTSMRDIYRMSERLDRTPIAGPYEDGALENRKDINERRLQYSEDTYANPR